MNKKGLMLATFAAVALLIALVVLASLGNKARGGLSIAEARGEGTVRVYNSYLGQEQVRIFSAYYIAEEEMQYLEFAAQLAAKDSKTTDAFLSQFDSFLNEYNILYGRDLKSEDFSFTFGAEIVATSAKVLEIKTERLVYRFRPSFKIQNLGIEEKPVSLK